MVKMRQTLSIVNNIRYRRPPRYDPERLNFPEVVTDYVQSLEAALPEVGELIEAPLEDCWSNVKAAINSAAEGAIDFVDRNRRNGLFDEECQTILDEKNAARAPS